MKPLFSVLVLVGALASACSKQQPGEICQQDADCASGACNEANGKCSADRFLPTGDTAFAVSVPTQEELDRVAAAFRAALDASEE